MNKARLREFLRNILEYEFETGYMGMLVSEFTPNIIDYEVSRLSKHRQEIDDSDKIYVFTRCSKCNKLRCFNSLEEALSNSYDNWDISYIIHDGKIGIVGTSGLEELRKVK